MQNLNRPHLPKYIRLDIYSYCDTKMVLSQLALISKTERETIRTSELMGKRRISLVFRDKNNNSEDYISKIRRDAN
jgi:hypothetical protein